MSMPADRKLCVSSSIPLLMFASVEGHSSLTKASRTPHAAYPARDVFGTGFAFLEGKATRM